MVAEWLSSWLAEQEMSGFRFPVSPLKFQKLDISCFQFAILLKYRLSDANPQYSQPIKQWIIYHITYILSFHVLISFVVKFRNINRDFY